MSDYAICQINGKQYKFKPNVSFNVDFLDKEGKIEVDVLLLSSGQDKIEIGTPILKEKIALDILGQELDPKIRVSKFHAKANYRRTTGIRPKRSKVVWSVKKAA